MQINTRQRLQASLSVIIAGGCLTFCQSVFGSSISNDALLFVGNSYTYQSVGHNGTSVDRFFDDAQISPFEAIVRAASNNRNTGSNSFLHLSGSQNISSPGQRLSQHTGVDAESQPTVLSDNNFEILDPNESAGRLWDAVILQDFSTVPAKTIAFTDPFSKGAYEDFYIQGLTPIANQLLANGQTSTKIVLFETWAREAVREPGFPSEFDTREEMYQLTQQAYAKGRDLLTFDTSTQAVQGEVGNQDPDLNGLGLPNPVVIAPVGTAIENLIDDSATSAEYAQLLIDGKVPSDVFDIIFDDTSGGSRDTVSHLDLAGEFLAAAVLFETIYEVSVLELIDNGDLTQSDLTNIWTQNGTDAPSGQQTLDLDVARYLAGISQETTGVPEPSSLVLLAGAGLVLTRRRRA